MNLNPLTTYNIQIISLAYGCESEIFNTLFTTEVNCIIPDNISLTATPFDVTLSWDVLDGADSYNIVYNLPGTGWQTTTVTDNFLTLSHNGNGLAYFYIRSVCSEFRLLTLFFSSIYRVTILSICKLRCEFYCFLFW